METETILDAMVMADRRRIAPSHIRSMTPNAQRQYHAFRARILRMDAERKALIDKLFRIIGDRESIIRDRAEEIAEKDARIAELESITYCAYCGKEYPVDDNASEVGEHIKTCKKHPLFEAQQIINDQDKRLTQQRKRIAELEEQIRTLENLRALYVHRLAAKDARIAELEELVELVNKHSKDRMVSDKRMAWAKAKELANDTVV